MISTLRVTVPDQDWIKRLTGLDERVELSTWDLLGPSSEGRIDLAVRPYMAPAAALTSLDPARIGVVQSQALGYDGVPEALPAGITYCNAIGVHEGSTAELGVALLLASQRRLDIYARGRGEWDLRRRVPSLADRRVMLLGYGGIGVELEKRLDGFDAELVRVAGHPREDERGVIHGAEELSALLPTVDAVMVAVPLNAATTGLIGDDFLAALPDDAVVVNVSRGKIADAEAVIRQAGRIRYATDVTDPEPLPADHPLWTAPGVFISPHVGGLTTAMFPRMEHVIRTQIEHLLDGREPQFVVISG